MFNGPNSVPAYKQTHLEVDIGNKSERIEWGHARYHSVYSVDQAFELVIEWVAASGSIISELVRYFKNLLNKRVANCFLF